MRRDIIIAAVVGDRGTYRKLLRPSITRTKLGHMVVDGHKDTCIATEFNNIIDRTTARYIIFCHPDVSFRADIIEAIDGSPRGLLGGVGKDWKKDYIWAMDREPGTYTPVLVFDACLFIYDRELGLRFDDKTFTGLHFYVEDMCYQARDKGIGLHVPYLTGFGHRGSATYGGNEAETYMAEKKKLINKWWRKFYVTTT